MPLPILPTKSLFDLYKREKESMEDALNPFPKFREWKDIYIKERQQEMDELCTSEVFVLDAEEINQQMDNEVVLPKKVEVKKPIKSTRTKALTNMDRARTIFQQMVDDSDDMPTRKLIMGAFIEQLKVSKACASTYHHNIKQKYN